MAEFPHQRPHAQNQPNYDSPTTHPFQAILPQKSISSSHLLAFLTLFPIAAILLFFAGISFIGTVVALAVTSPLFLIFSPVLVPAALVIALAVAGFLTSGAFGVTALSSLSWMANYLRRSRVPLNLDQAKQWVRETAAQAAETAKEAGQAIQSKAQDNGKAKEVEVGSAQDGEKTDEVSPAQPSPAQEEGKTQAQSTSKEETAQEPAKAQESGKAQEGGKAQDRGKAQGGKTRGGGKT
uniref:Oleosin n=2 Tax=Cucumis sativus TaxID=3659 RepID=A0A0A0LR99_CUCSA